MFNITLCVSCCDCERSKCRIPCTWTQGSAFSILPRQDDRWGDANTDPGTEPVSRFRALMSQVALEQEKVKKLKAARLRLLRQSQQESSEQQRRTGPAARRRLDEASKDRSLQATLSLFYYSTAQKNAPSLLTTVRTSSHNADGSKPPLEPGTRIQVRQSFKLTTNVFICHKLLRHI